MAHGQRPGVRRAPGFRRQAGDIHESGRHLSIPVRQRIATLDQIRSIIRQLDDSTPRGPKSWRPARPRSRHLRARRFLAEAVWKTPCGVMGVARTWPQTLGLIGALAEIVRDRAAVGPAERWAKHNAQAARGNRLTNTPPPHPLGGVWEA